MWQQRCTSILCCSEILIVLILFSLFLLDTRLANVYLTYALDRYLSKGYDEAWIGLDTQDNSSTLTWLNGYPVHYTSWEQNEPQNKSGCVSLSRDKLWRVRVCNNTLPSICLFYPNGHPTTPPHNVHGNCPIMNGIRNSTKIGTKCYHVESKKLRTWDDAKYKCSFIGGHLLSIHNEEQQNVITTLLQNNTITDAWIGLTYDSVLDYRWTDFTAIDYLNIDNNATHHNDNFTIYHINSTDGKWQPSSWNNKRRPYICWAYRGHYKPTTTPPPTTFSTFHWTIPSVTVITFQIHDSINLAIIIGGCLGGISFLCVFFACIKIIYDKRSLKSRDKTGDDS